MENSTNNITKTVQINSNGIFRNALVTHMNAEKRKQKYNREETENKKENFRHIDTVIKRKATELSKTIKDG